MNRVPKEDLGASLAPRLAREEILQVVREEGEHTGTWTWLPKLFAAIFGV